MNHARELMHTDLHLKQWAITRVCTRECKHWFTSQTVCTVFGVFSVLCSVYIYTYVCIVLCCFQHLSVCRHVPIHAAGVAFTAVVVCRYAQSRCCRLHPKWARRSTEQQNIWKDEYVLPCNINSLLLFNVIVFLDNGICLVNLCISFQFISQPFSVCTMFFICIIHSH